jgi:asparagine synthase (glutamine-hydrolysing)
VWDPGARALDDVVARMAATLRHRGPDSGGRWCDPAAGIAFGHRRLAILDLSDEGHQPMQSASGRWVITFNGEIYNFRVLRDELLALGAKFRGGSDTEVMLAAFERWGPAGALARFAGMFAFALFDRETRTLHLARDRLGEKPLYFGRAGAALVFASELKALRAHPRFDGEVDRGALALYLRQGYVPAPYSIYRGVRKLPPAMLLSIDAAGRETWHAYWSPHAAAEAGVREPMRGKPREVADELEQTLARAVKDQMVSDVPLGAFLSGGIDSTLIVSLMQEQSGQPVRTFTIGFDEKAYDEADHARAVARHLGTDHTELTVTGADALALVPRLPALYDEPFADASQIPTYLVAQLARRRVTVALSGDGGDELFAGYNRYFWGRRLWRILRLVPAELRTYLATNLRRVPSTRWDEVLVQLNRAAPRALQVSPQGHKIDQLAAVLDAPSGEAMYRQIVATSGGPTLVRDTHEPPTLLTDVTRWPRLGGLLPSMMYLDLVTYLPDDVLVKVDRATMAVSLESRAPFLDHRVAELAWRVPLSLKIRDGRGKWILRELVHRRVPRALVDRPKMGFGVPVAHWLRGPLRDWAEALLAPERLRREGFFDVEPLRRRWDEHLRGQRDWERLLWSVLLFQGWREATG